MIRRRSLLYLVMSLILGLSILLWACAPSASTAPTGGQPSKPAAHAGWPTLLTISGGTIGGMTNLDAAFWAAVAKKYAGIDSTVLTNETMLQAKIVCQGLADISTSTTPSNQDVYTNTGQYAMGTPCTKLRALLPDSSYPMQVLVPVKSPIQKFTDLIGKKIGIRLTNSFAGYTLRAVLIALGYNPDKDVTIQEMAYEDGATRMTLGTLDAYEATGLPPHATFGQTDLTNPLRLVGLTDAELQKVLSTSTAFTPYQIPAQYYHMTQPITTVDAPGVGVTTTDLPGDLAYALVKGRVEDPTLGGYYHITLQQYIQQGRVKDYVESGSGIPYAAGAIRYFKEAGWNVPAKVIPPEYKP